MLEFIGAFLRENEAALLFTVLGLGYAIGKTKLRGFELGPVSGVLLVGLVFGHYGYALSAAAQCYVCSGQFECEDWAYTTTGCPFSGEYPPWYECENIQGMCTVYYGDLPAELGIEESDVLTIEILIAEELVAMSVTEVDDGLYGWWNCDGEIQYLYEKTEEGWVPAKNILLNRAKYSIAKLSQ